MLNEKDIAEQVSTEKSYIFWQKELDAASAREKKWREEAEKCEKRYAGESEKNDKVQKRNDRYNIFYSNTQILKSALLPEIPQAVIERRFAKQQAQDEKEKQFYTTVSEIVERAVSFNTIGCGLENELENFKYDYLVAGRAVLWLSFVCDIEEKVTHDEYGQEIREEVVKNEKIKIEHINYDDFRMSDGKKWADVWWIARRHCLNKEDFKKKFGEIADKVKFETPGEDNKYTSVWEIWDKSERQVLYVCDGYDGIIGQKGDPYNLDDFYPTPEPLRSIKRPQTMVPIPEFKMYEKEADALTEAAVRTDKLIKSIKANAFYPAKFRNEISKINSASDDEYIAVDVSGEINDLGGMDKVFAYNPIETKQKVAYGLYQQQEKLVKEIYEITGISDIMRNVSASETATATRQKGKFGSLRLQERQGAINGYIKQIYGIITELVCELYTAQTLRDITSMQLPMAKDKESFAIMQSKQAQIGQIEDVPSNLRKFMMLPTWEEVKSFMEDNRLRSYLLDIETNYSIFDTEIENQKARTEMFTVFTKAIQESMGIVAQVPKLAGVFGKLTSFVLDSYRMSRTLKNGIEDALAAVVEEIELKSQEPQKAQNPADMLAQAEIMKAQAEQLSAQARLKEAQIKAAQSEQKMKLDEAKTIVDAQYKQTTAQREDAKAVAQAYIDKQRIDLEKAKEAAKIFYKAH